MNANQVAAISNPPRSVLVPCKGLEELILFDCSGNHKYYNININSFNLRFKFNIIPMKQTPTSQSRISKHTATTKQLKPKHKSTNYLQLSNEEYLKRNLMLLGVTEASFLKQTKCSLQVQLFPKHQANPTATKHFFYVSYVCLQNLTSTDERATVQMWYPPRTVNQQVEYKKAFFKVVQNLQILGRVPKNMVVSKGTIMGDSTSQTLVEFLRFLSEMALRNQYLQKYSHQQRLIQISCNQSPSVPDNNINKFYIHPFVPSLATTNLDHQSLDLNNLTEVYHNHLKIYFKKLVKLRTKNVNPVLAEMHQNLLRNFMEQKQLNDTLSEKVPKAILGENRAFDRRRIIDRNEQIWDELNKMECKYVQVGQVPIIKVEGEVDQLLQKWQPVKGISNILQANSLLKSSTKLKKQLHDQMAKFKELCSKIEAQMKK